MTRSVAPERLSEALAALKEWAASDPSSWNTGLSTEGARLAQKTAESLIVSGTIPSFTAPNHTVIWCAANVFTAPLEWVVQLTANGGTVTLKAPSDSPESAIGIAEAFSCMNVKVHTAPFAESWGLLERADAVIGFGATASMESLSNHLRPETTSSLHGHMVSIAIVDSDAGDLSETAASLAMDLTLYDGRGCMSPVAIFVLGSKQEGFAYRLSESLEAAEKVTPRGDLSPREGAEWRRKTGLSRILGLCIEGDNWAVATSPLEHFEPYGQPRMASIYCVDTIDSALEALHGVPLSTCGTNVDGGLLEGSGFTRICQLGEMQSPPVNRLHDGVDVLKKLTGAG